MSNDLRTGRTDIDPTVSRFITEGDDQGRKLTFPNGYEITYTYRVVKQDADRDLQVERRKLDDGSIVWVVTRISEPVFGAINVLFTAREAYELFRII